MNTNSNIPEWLNIEVEKRPQAILDELSGSSKLSDSIQEILRLSNKADSPMKPVVEALSKSPALAASVLKVANSPVYSPSHPITNLKRAVTIIGMRELHTMAAGLAMMAMFSNDSKLSKIVNDTSVIAATIASHIAQSIGHIDPSTAFLAGLLSEIGALACNYCDSAGFEQIWDESENVPEKRHTLESKRYGTTTEITGGQLILQNGLPKNIAESIECTFEEAKSHKELLPKITLFSRYAAYLLIRAGNQKDLTILKENIPKLAKDINLEQPSTDKLFTICIESAVAANLGIKGEAQIYTQVEEDYEASLNEKKSSSINSKNETIKSKTKFLIPILIFCVLAFIISLIIIFNQS